jgi:hypothetical protein
MSNPARGEGRASIEQLCWVVLVHQVATVAMTYPAVFYAHSDLFGAVRGDKYQFIWNFWLMKHALIDLGEFPLYTHLQYFPTGVSLALHDMTSFWSLLSVPLQLFLDPRVALNLFLLSCFTANGVAFYLLARDAVKDHWGALAGSVAFAYCPYLLGRFQVCHIQYLGVFFLPLFLRSLSRYRRDPRASHLAGAGLWLALQSLISFYYGVALLAILLLFLAYQVARSREQWRRAAFWRALGLHSAGLAVVAAALLAPVVAPMLRQIHRGDFRDATAPSSHRYLEQSSGDLVSYFLPDFTLAPWRGWGLSDATERGRERLAASLYGNPFEKAVYPGWLGWIAVLVVLASGELRRRFWPWVLLALGSFLVTLGPTLYLMGEPHLDGLLPLRLVSDLPVINIIRAPTRFAVFLSLGTGVLVAAAIARVRERRGHAVAAGLAIACMAFACAEFIPRPLSHFRSDLWVSPFYAKVRSEAERYSILNVPVDFEAARAGGDLFQFAQVFHGKPIVGGYVSREPHYVFGPLRESPFLQSVLDRSHEPDPRLRLGDPGFADMRPTLRKLEVRYVIVHRVLLSPEEWQRVSAWLERGLGRAIHEDRWIRVYRFDPDSAEMEPERC